MYRQPKMIILLVCLLLIAGSSSFSGCDEDVSNPTFTNDPNDGGGDNGGGGDNEPLDLGTEYFHSTSETSWSTGEGIRIQNGNIFAENVTDSVMTEDICYCVTDDLIDFGRSMEMAFAWTENVNGEGNSSIYVSESGDRWQEIPHSLQADLRVARFTIIIGSPIYFVRFAFELQPHSAVTISNIRGYGK